MSGFRGEKEWAWSTHPKNNRARVRMVAADAVCVEFNHPHGMESISHGVGVSRWILESPKHFGEDPGTWCLYGIESRLIHEAGTFLLRLTFRKEVDPP